MRWLLLLSTLLPLALVAQEPDTTRREGAIEKLTYQQQPGLAMAASKIFFSERRWSISGFGEVNYVHYRGTKSTDVGDIELYYTDLYRSATFFGYRFSDKVIWNSEFQIELLRDGPREYHTEIIFEAFVDVLLHPKFNTRVGWFPLFIGYVNNNDEPVMFYSVNRSEVERIIVPSSWIDPGVQVYGTLRKGLSYGLGFTHGLDSRDFIGATWIRQGRGEFNFGPKGMGFHGQLQYQLNERLSGATGMYYGFSGQGNVLPEGGTYDAPVGLYTSFLKWEKGRTRVVTLGAYGTLGDTPAIERITAADNGNGQVLGRETYGALFEVGHDLLPLFRKAPRDTTERRLWDPRHQKLPVFVRYERLDTHLSLDRTLAGLPVRRSDLDIVTFGLNFNMRENIVLKANYQWRNNRSKDVTDPREPDFVELGIGFIY
ncbi:MAG: porin [Flavobacteriales bacterium]|nr:porin [Flavobacteriales bacterium]